ncbi:MAG: metal ABC transporter solute-binding protein, Zn/Mn family [Phycisphaerales bacterium JB040]
MPTTIRVLLASLLALALGSQASCSRREQREPGPMRVVVSVPPLAGIVRPLLPEDAEVKILIGPGSTPHAYEMIPSDLSAIARADLVVGVGMGLDSRIIKAAQISAEFARVVVFADAAGIESDGHDHDHSGAGHDHADHAHTGGDPHLWLDPSLAKMLQEAVAVAIEAEPTRLASAMAELDDLDRSLSVRLNPVLGKSFVTHHDSLSRFAERYGFRIAASVRVLETVDPTPAELTEAARKIEEAGAVAILTEPQMPRGAAERLADMSGLTLATIDPLGRGDYAETLQGIADTLIAVAGAHDGP